MRRIYSRSLPEPPSTPGRTLTLDRYLEMHRLDHGAWAAFNDWMRAEDLTGKLIIEATFGEARLEVDCYDVDENGRMLLASPTEAARFTKTFTLRTPPPSSVLPFLV